MKKKYIRLIIALILVISVIAAYLFFKSRQPKEEYSTVKVAYGPVIQTVSEIGTIKPIQELSLMFMTSGRISEVAVKVGDEVIAGQALASLDKQSLELKKIEAESGLKIAQANLSKILVGASTESVAVSQSEIYQAQASESAARVDLEKVKKSVAESISQAKKTLSDLESDSSDTSTTQEQAVYSAQTALNNTKLTGQRNIENSRSSVLLTLSDRILTGKIALDNLNTILEDDNAENVLGVKNSSTLPDTKNSRLAALSLMPAAESAVSKAKNSGLATDIELAGSAVRAFLAQTSLSLNYAYSLLEATITSAGFSQTQLDAYKSLVSTQNNQVSTAVTAVENTLQTFNNSQISYSTSLAAAEESLRQAKVSLESSILLAKNSLSSLNLSSEQQISSAQARLDSAVRSVALARARFNNISAPARNQDISLAEAQVSQAAASLANIEKQILDSVLIAPLNGTITQVNYSVGEQFGLSGQPMIMMLADGNFEIEVDISESDINKIKIGDTADITLDAFSEDLIFPGRVNFVEPAQTLIQGVVYYKVKINFTDLTKIKEDLSAINLSLKSGMTANVLVTTDKRERVLQVPARAVIEQDNKKIIRVLASGQVNEIPVQVGLRGDDGLVEIVSGLIEGDEVVTFIKNTTN